MEEKDIDKLLREKANSIDDNKYNYKVNVDEIKLKANSKRKGIVLKISVISTLTACIIAFMVFTISKKFLFSNNNVVIQGNNEISEKFRNEDIIDTVVYDKHEKIFTDEFPAFIGIIKVKQVEQKGIIDDIPITIVKSSIIDSLYINEKYKNNIQDTLDFYILSCVYEIENIPDNINQFVTSDYGVDKKDKYLKVVQNDLLKDIAYPEIEKEYIVTLSVEDEKYHINNISKYKFYEYDENTKKVKIGNEWQDIDNKYVVW